MDPIGRRIWESIEELTTNGADSIHLLSYALRLFLQLLRAMN